MNKTCLAMLLVALYSLGSVCPVVAQLGQEWVDIPIRLNEAIEIALMKRLEIRLGEVQIEGAQARVNEAKGAFSPTLDLSANLQRIEVIDAFSGVEIVGTIGGEAVALSIDRDIPRYLIDSGLEAKLNLYAGGLHTADLAEAHAVRMDVEAQQAVTRKNIIMEVTTAYWKLRKAQIVQTSALRNADFAREEVRIATARYQEGRLSEIERETKVLHYLEKEITVTEANQQARDRLQRYILALGLSEEFEGMLPEQVGPLVDDPEQLNIESLVERFLYERRPELLKAQAEVEAANARKKASQAELYPTVDLFSRYAVAGRDPDTLGAALSDLRGQDWAVGMRLSWNLFNGFQTKQRIAQAHSEARVATLRLEQTQMELSNKLREKSLDVERLENKVSLEKKRLTLRQAQERIAKTRWEMHQISRLEFDAARLDVQAAASELTTISIDLVIARIAFFLAFGS